MLAHPTFPAWDIRAEINLIDTPLLLIQGERDQYGTLKQLDQIEKAAPAPVERMHLDCQHSPHLERPAETLEHITASLRGCRPPVLRHRQRREHADDDERPHQGPHTLLPAGTPIHS